MKNNFKSVRLFLLIALLAAAFLPAYSQSSGSCDASFSTCKLSAPGLNIQFTNTSAGDYTNSLWSFGDGDTSLLPNPVHIYSSSKPFSVACLTVSNATVNCHSTVCDTVYANTPVCSNTPCIDSGLIGLVAAFPQYVLPVCGCNGVTYINSYYAEYGAGVTSWTLGPCQATQTCQSSFTYQPVSTATAGNVVQFTNTSTGNYDHLLWTFGDGDSSRLPDPLHDYSTFKPDYIACLTISDSSGSCSSTTCDTIRLTDHSKCIDTGLINRLAACPNIYAPVCGCNGITYINSCVAENYFGVSSWTRGRCYHIYPVIPLPFPFGFSPPVNHGYETPEGEKIAAYATDDEYENFALEIYPNPASDKTNIVYILPEQSELMIDVIDLVGNTVAHLFSGIQSEGEQQLTLQTGTMANGIYLVRVIVNSNIHTQKLSVIH